MRRHGIRPRVSKPYRNLNRRIREYVRNEVNRLLNYLTVQRIREFVVEKLDFRRTGLSKRLNRILTRAGRGAVKRKLASLTDIHGITVTEVQSAYTSQTCSGCGYSDRRNRSSQKRFVCRFCGRKLLADINAARNILGRSREKCGFSYRSKERTLAEIDARFRASWRVNPADLRERQTRGRSTASPP